MEGHQRDSVDAPEVVEELEGNGIVEVEFFVVMVVIGRRRAGMFCVALNGISAELIGVVAVHGEFVLTPRPGVRTGRRNAFPR